MLNGKDYALGFTTQSQEIAIDQLPTAGTIPEWLSGTLIRNGPGQFEVGDQSYRHWFDGLAMLHSFRFHQGQVSYANRFVRSNAYHRDNALGTINYRGFAVDPCRSIFSKVMSMFSAAEDMQGGNTNVNVVRLADRFLAMTETPLPIEFDPRTLETLGVVGYDDALAGQITTAHPHYDPEQRLGFNFLTHVSARNHYNVYTIEGMKRQLLASIPVKQPGYMHSFGLSKRYVVLVEFSLRLKSPVALALGDQPFIRNFVWSSEQDTIFYVIDRQTGAVAAQAAADPFFAFHHINAFDDGDTVAVDLCAYPDSSLIDELFLDPLRDASKPYPQMGEFRRYRVPLKGGRAAYEVMCSERLDLPRIHYARVNGCPYRYVYGVGASREGASFLNQLVKVDLEHRAAALWREEGCFPGEPVFIEKPGSDREDDGAVVSVVLDSRTGRSFLLVLDGGTFAEIGRAWVPQHVPFGFHGQYFGDVI